jgi:hypothetical protein
VLGTAPRQSAGGVEVLQEGATRSAHHPTRAHERDPGDGPHDVASTTHFCDESSKQHHPLSPEREALHHQHVLHRREGEDRAPERHGSGTHLRAVMAFAR